MITQYSQPLQQSIVDQYVPIPFEQIGKIGESYKKDYNEAEMKQLAYNEKLGSVMASSKKDAEALSIMKDKLSKAAEKYGSNSDMLKSAEGRSEIAATINSMDFGLLKKIDASTRNMEKQNDMINQMKVAGTYNPLWHGSFEEDMLNHDSSKAVYQPKAMAGYATDEAIVNRIAGPLNPGWAKDANGNIITHNGFAYKQVTAGDVNKIVNGRKWSDDEQMKSSIKADQKLGIAKANMTQDELEAYAKQKAYKVLGSEINKAVDIQQIKSTKSSAGAGSGASSKSPILTPVSVAANNTFGYLSQMSKQNSKLKVNGTIPTKYTPSVEATAYIRSLPGVTVDEKGTLKVPVSEGITYVGTGKTKGYFDRARTRNLSFPLTYNPNNINYSFATTKDKNGKNITTGDANVYANGNMVMSYTMFQDMNHDLYSGDEMEARFKEAGGTIFKDGNKIDGENSKLRMPVSISLFENGSINRRADVEIMNQAKTMPIYNAALESETDSPTEQE